MVCSIGSERMKFSENLVNFGKISVNLQRDSGNCSQRQLAGRMVVEWDIVDTSSASPMCLQGRQGQWQRQLGRKWENRGYIRRNWRSPTWRTAPGSTLVREGRGVVGYGVVTVGWRRRSESGTGALARGCPSSSLWHVLATTRGGGGMTKLLELRWRHGGCRIKSGGCVN